MLLALAAGYVLGAHAGSRDFDQLVDAVRAIRDSDEFNDFLAGSALMPARRCASSPTCWSESDQSRSTAMIWWIVSGTSPRRG